MIDFGFIAQLEGRSLVGYVPLPDGGNVESGVTIACGFDVGQRSLQDLEHLPFIIATKLAPYVGLTGADAIRKLNHIPLQITEQECSYINAFAHSEAVDKLLYNWRKSGTELPFTALADECQTVIASVAFQYGHLPSRTPNFWRQITTGKWWNALANLRDFGDRFPTRRNKEADLLERRLTNELIFN